MSKSCEFPTGKVPPEVLKDIVFRRLGVSSNRVILGPRVGEDAAVIEMGDRVLVLATDPITGAVRNIGWYVIHINANVVSACGARPLWFFCTILLPVGAKKALLKEIMGDMDRAAKELSISIIGGHSETTPGLSRPILVGFMIGETTKEKYVSTSGAMVKDVLILTKGAGIEGTAVLASDLDKILEEKQIEKGVIAKARGFISSISVVKEAITAMEAGEVHSMHDPTEGGILNGIWEMAEASNKGVIIFKEKIMIARETKILCKALEIDSLKILGSGALLIAVKQKDAKKIVSAIIDKGIKASIIGEITPLKKGRWIVDKEGTREKILPITQDHVYKILDRYGL